MNWRELLKTELESTFKVAADLVELVDDGDLDWKPATGSNWMTVAQLLHHLGMNNVGATFKGFIGGDWGMPAGAEMNPEDMLPPAEKLPAVSSVAEALAALATDKALAIEWLAKATDADLDARPTPAPWDPTPTILGRRLLQMVYHLALHKAQLFYYLKLMGRPVHTGHLWGM